MSNDLTLMRSLVAVSDHGTITEAALALGVTQPALSRRIAMLEEELGTPMFERSPRGVVLTELGRLVDREARDLIARYERLTRDIGAHLRLDAGTVRLGGGATAVSFIVPEAIASFQREHPGVRFQVKEASSREIEDDVRSERLELGIVTLPLRGSDLDVTETGTDDIALVCAKQHRFAGARTVPVADLAGENLVGFEAGSAIRSLIDSALRDADVDMDVVMELRSIPAILRMVAASKTLAFVSSLGVPADDQTICSVRVRGLRIRRKLAVIRHPRRPLSPAAAAFCGLFRLRSLSRSRR